MRNIIKSKLNYRSLEISHGMANLSHVVEELLEVVVM
jgi:hypothetical protein